MGGSDTSFSRLWSEELAAVGWVLLNGGVVALPTDTLFGLAANVHDDEALRKIFEIKGRPSSQPLPVLVNGIGMAGRVVEAIPKPAERLAAKFWPGPLTLVLPSKSDLSPVITAGGNTVAVRSPNHWVPLELMNRLGIPLTGTSANRSGGPDLQTASEIRTQLGDVLDAVVDVGPAPLGAASTIVAIEGDDLRLVRQGVVPFSEVLEVFQG